MSNKLILLSLIFFILFTCHAWAVKFEARLTGYGTVSTGKIRFGAHKLDYFARMEISDFCPDLPAQDAYNPTPPKVTLYLQPLHPITNEVILKPKNKKKFMVELSAHWQRKAVNGKMRYDRVIARSNFGPPHGFAPGPAYVVLEYKYKGKTRKLTIGKWTSQKPPSGIRIYYASEYIYYRSDIRIPIGFDMFPRTHKGFIGMPPGIPAAHFWPRYCKAYSIRVQKKNRPSGKFNWMKPWAKPSDPRQGYKIQIPGTKHGEWTIEYKIVAPMGFYPGDLPKLAKYGFYKVRDPKKKNRADDYVRYKGKMKDGYPVIKKVLRYR